MQPEKLKRKQAADYLDVKEGTLEAWATRGGGPPYIKIGRCVRYLKSDLDQWIASRRVTHTAQLGE